MKLLTLAISSLTLLLVAAPVAGSHPVSAQDAEATLTIKTDFEPPVSSVIRVFGQQSSAQCAEVAAANGGSSKSVSVPSRSCCALSNGDNLSFWLFTGEGSGELLTTADGQPVKWQAGKALIVTLVRVPCPDPCRPPDIAGVPDTGFGSTDTDAATQADGDDGFPLLAIGGAAALIAIAVVGLGLMARRLPKR